MIQPFHWLQRMPGEMTIRDPMETELWANKAAFRTSESRFTSPPHMLGTQLEEVWDQVEGSSGSNRDEFTGSQVMFPFRRRRSRKVPIVTSPPSLMVCSMVPV